MVFDPFPQGYPADTEMFGSHCPVAFKHIKSCLDLILFILVFILHHTIVTENIIRQIRLKHPGPDRSTL